MTGAALFRIFLLASLFSFGGLGGLPILHQQLVDQTGWASEATFAQALAIGLISPGPNGLYVVSLGYLLLAWPGAIAAALALMFPPLLVLPMAAAYERLAHQRRVQSAVHALGLAVAGLVGYSAFAILRGTVSDWVGIGIALCVFALMTRTRIHVIVPLAFAGALGVLVYR